MKKIQLSDLGHRCAISGLSGMGKTYLSVKLFDEVKTGLFFDTMGVYDKLGGKKNYAPVRLDRLPQCEAEWERIFYYIRTHKKVILNMRRLIPRDYVQLADRICTFLLTREWKDYAVFVDEIGDYIPEGRGTYSVELERLIRAGRNFGITPFVGITQRLAKPDKELIGICESYITFRTVFDLDLKRLKEIMSRKSMDWESMENNLQELPVGEFMFYKNGEVRL